MKPVVYIIWIGFLSLAAAACGSESASRRGAAPPVNGADQPPKASDAGANPGGSNTPQTGGKDAGGNPGAEQDSSNIPIVLGFFGGFTSCQGNAGTPNPKDQDLSDAFEQSLAALDEVTDKDPVTIMSCFTADPSQVHYVTSIEPDKVRSVALGELGKDIGTFLMTKAPGSRVRLVGHSYGGWTVLSLAKDLDPKIKVDALVTLDPISVRDCNAGVVLAGGEGCRRAPADFGDQGLAFIKNRVGKWVNFYQTSDTILFSGPMNGAENARREYPRGALVPHSAFLDDSVVLDKIADVTAGNKP